MDLVTIIGLVVGFGGILLGMILEGGHVGSIIQGTAAIIVFGGTIGAVMISTTREDLITGLKMLRLGFGDKKDDNVEQVVKELVEAAQIARKDSMLALERRLATFSNPFMQNVFRFMIDGVEPHLLRDLFEAQLAIEEENMMAGVKMYTDAGGFAPTIGIIGAVLGLIHVMSNLTDTSKLGAGIAVAFVATVYGIASANLLFLPLANKIKRKAKQQIETKYMILEGAVGIMTGMSPFILQEKLNSYMPDPAKRQQSRNMDAA